MRGKKIYIGGKKIKKHQKNKKNITRKKKSKKSKKSKKIYSKKQCSPRNKKNIYDFTCYTKKSLEKLKDIWNIRRPNSQIETYDPKKIWIELESILKNIVILEKLDGE